MSPLRRTTPPKRKRRSTAERARVYGPPEFRDWLHAQPCAVSGVRGHIEQAHAVNGGTGRKADWQFTFPISAELHRRLHTQGVKTCEAEWGVTLLELCRRTQQAWRAAARRRSA